MARIVGIDLPREKRVVIGLTYIYGIGRPSAEKIVADAGVNPDTRVRDLTDDEVARLVSLNIKRLTEIGCYRGVRHRKSLPVRGQRTKTNARTRKGKIKAVGAKRKK